MGRYTTKFHMLYSQRQRHCQILEAAGAQGIDFEVVHSPRQSHGYYKPPVDNRDLGQLTHLTRGLDEDRSLLECQGMEIAVFKIRHGRNVTIVLGLCTGGRTSMCGWKDRIMQTSARAMAEPHQHRQARADSASTPTNAR